MTPKVYYLIRFKGKCILLSLVILKLPSQIILNAIEKDSLCVVHLVLTYEDRSMRSHVTVKYGTGESKWKNLPMSTAVICPVCTQISGSVMVWLYVRVPSC